MTVDGPNGLEIGKVYKYYLEDVLEYFRPACEVETKNRRVHSLSTLDMREMRKTALSNLLWLEVVNDVVEDIIKRKQPIAPLEELKIMPLYDVKQPLYDLKVLYLPCVQFPQEPYQKVLLQQKIGEQI